MIFSNTPKGYILDQSTLLHGVQYAMTAETLEAGAKSTDSLKEAVSPVNDLNPNYLAAGKYYLAQVGFDIYDEKHCVKPGWQAVIELYAQMRAMGENATNYDQPILSVALRSMGMIREANLYRAKYPHIFGLGPAPQARSLEAMISLRTALLRYETESINKETQMTESQTLDGIQQFNP